MNRSRQFHETGQTLAEFALVAGLLFMLLDIIVELGIVFSVYTGLTNSARETALAGSIYQFQQTTNPPQTPAYTTVDTARTAVMNTALTKTLNPMIVSANLQTTYSYDPSTPPNDNSNNYRYDEKVIVTLEYRYPLFFNLINSGHPLVLRATSEMKLEPGGQ